MTASSLLPMIGQEGTAPARLGKVTIRVPVRVLDARTCWDRTDYQVEYDGVRVWIDAEGFRAARQEGGE